MPYLLLYYMRIATYSYIATFRYVIVIYIELANIAVASYSVAITIGASEATSHLQGSITHSQVQQDTQTMDSKSYV